MPYVNIRLARGGELTRDKKRILIEGITRLLLETLDKKPEHTHIVIDEVEPDNWGFAGMLVTEYRNKQSR